LLHSYSGYYNRLVSGKAEFNSQMELMGKLIAVLLLFQATAYAPDSIYSESSQKFISSRAVNGDSYDSWGLLVTEFTIACSLRYHGYIFIFTSDIPESNVRYCTDSVEYGKNPNRIDIAITEGTNDERVKKAFEFGRKQVSVKIISGKDFLECRDISIPETKIEFHQAVLAQMYLRMEDCL
jgi:hypothetical protein